MWMHSGWFKKGAVVTVDLWGAKLNPRWLHARTTFEALAVTDIGNAHGFRSWHAIDKHGMLLVLK